jgi:single-strand DNA-binding protein
MTNTCVLTGRVGKDPELKQIGSTQLTTFSLAVNRGQKDSEGNYITDWFNIELWGKSAELAHRLVKKGNLLTCTGRIQIDKYTKDGKESTLVMLNANSFNILVSDKNTSSNAANTNIKAPATKQQSNHELIFDDSEIPPF